MQNENKVCFITCVNNEVYYEEAKLYLHRLKIPLGIEVEFLPIRGAVSMTQGYNEAMKKTDAKYKVYLHQDILVINRNIIEIILNVFAGDSSIGMIGIAGAEQIPTSAVWWRAKKKYGAVYHVFTWESFRKIIYGSMEDLFCSVQAIDGIFMATQYDIPWREDLFKGWHFYDISQSMEFLRQHYAIVVPKQDEPWCIHMCGSKDLDREYKIYQERFLQEYGYDMNKYTVQVNK